MRTDPELLSPAAERYGTTAGELKPLSGGHFTYVYEYKHQGRPAVLRIIPPDEHYDRYSVQAIVVWTKYLHEHGVSVPEPILSSVGKIVEVVRHNGKNYTVVATEKVPGVLAEDIPPDEWSPRLFECLGQTVGKLHQVSTTYVPPAKDLRRPEWNKYASRTAFRLGETLDESQHVIADKLDEVLSHLKSLPVDRENYGLAHLDLHFANFLVDMAGGCRVTIFDFDDCAYSWYMMDIAMLLFDVLVLYPDADTEDFAWVFLTSFLRGYIREKPITSFWVEQMPHFLKLLEIEIYSRLYKSYKPDDDDPWISKFMPCRREYIEEGVPYIDLDFAEVMKSLT